jgi:rod shape-determining protein MreB
MRLRAGVAIDLGTVNTLVWVSGRGLVVEEPSAIAVDTSVGKAIAAGAAADALAGKEPRDVQVIHPLRDGVIADLDAATAMLQDFFGRARLRRGLLRSRAVVCVPSGATWVERQALATAVETRRPRCTVRIVEEPVAAAAGAGFDLSGGSGAFIVDIGGGTTEIAVVAGGRLVRADSLRLAGNAMDEAIVHTVRTELGLLIGLKAARRLKTALGLTGGITEWAETVGVDVRGRTPRVQRVPGKVVADAVEPCVATIVEAVREILLDLPPDLAEDIVRGKICLAGGGALLPGLASRIEVAAGISALVVDDPLRCVVRGAAEILEGRDGLAA